MWSAWAWVMSTASIGGPNSSSEKSGSALPALGAEPLAAIDEQPQTVDVDGRARTADFLGSAEKGDFQHDSVASQNRRTTGPVVIWRMSIRGGVKRLDCEALVSDFRATCLFDRRTVRLGRTRDGGLMKLIDRIKRLPSQLAGRNPFGGSMHVERLPVLRTAYLTATKFRTPLKILDDAFRDDVDLKYLDVPGFPPILFVRDPEMIRTIAVETANQGDFDRDTLPTQGIARVVGGRNLLFTQGDEWKRHRAAASRPLGTGAVFKPEIYQGIEAAVKRAVEPQLEILAEQVRRSPTNTHRMQLETEIKAAMLSVLVHVLFGSDVPHEELRNKYLPAIENVIRYILVDTVANPFRLPVFRIPSFSKRHAQIKEDRRTFEELVDRVVRTRSEGAGFWQLLKGDAPEEAVHSNVHVFLAGALEATASYVSWALVNLARHPEARAKAYAEAAAHSNIGPEAREKAVYLQQVLAESLRLNNALYFLPRTALRTTKVATSKGDLEIPAFTHIILATYHMNRCDRHWGVNATGFPAADFVPERWDAANMAARGRSSKDNLHFGFGHGPRVCIGKHFSEVEAFVCLTLFLRRFEFTAVGDVEADSGVSTRPADKVELICLFGSSARNRRGLRARLSKRQPARAQFFRKCLSFQAQRVSFVRSYLRIRNTIAAPACPSAGEGTPKSTRDELGERQRRTRQRAAFEACERSRPQPLAAGMASRAVDRYRFDGTRSGHGLRRQAALHDERILLVANSPVKAQEANSARRTEKGSGRRSATAMSSLFPAIPCNSKRRKLHFNPCSRDRFKRRPIHACNDSGIRSDQCGTSPNRQAAETTRPRPRRFRRSLKPRRKNSSSAIRNRRRR